MNRPDLRLGEHATIRPCKHCPAHVLACRVYGAVVEADPVNLTALGELTARQTRRDTYDIRIVDFPPRMILRYRGLDDIKSPRRYPVVAAHACNQPLETGPSPPYEGWRIPKATAQPEQPPF